MPTVRLSEELYGFLQEQGNGETVDSIIRRLLNLDELRGRIVRKQVNRSVIAPREAYTWSILHSFGDDNVLLRRELQRRVGEYLRRMGLFDIYPADNDLMRHRQPRWKVRFGGALDRLKEHGCIESVGEYNHNYQGGQYRITQNGQDVLEDLWLHIDGDKSLVCLTAVAGKNNPVERWEIPPALLGEAKSVNGRLTVKAHVGE